MKLQHKLTKAYLSRAEKKFTLSNIQAARNKFEAATNSKNKPKVKLVKDTVIGSVNVRLYSNSTKSKLPAIIYFHSGGFVLGSLNSEDTVCRYITTLTDCVVVSVDYSLAPESTYPKPVNEGLEVLRLLNGKEFDDLDISGVFLAGSSAGGNIALNVALKAQPSDNLKGLILIYPTLDPTLVSSSMEQFATGHFLTKAMMKEFWSLYQGNQKYQLPTKLEIKQLPPVMFVAAEQDVLRDEGVDFVEKLRSLGKEVDYESYDDMLHGFVQFPKIASRKVKAFQRIASFVSRYSI